MDKSRRNFLKGSAGIGTLAAFKLQAGANTADLLGKESKKVASVCEMCSSRCPIEVRVEDGKGVFIQGNPKFGNKTSVCARGGAGVNQLYDDQRLVKPLIRVGARGEGKWKEVSWEEAFKFAADKLAEISEKYGPQSVVFTSKASENHNQMINFACAYGSPNIYSHWSCCPVAYRIALPHTFGSDMQRDYGDAKYIVNFGHNLFEGIDISKTKKLAKTAAKKDAKLLVLEPRFSVVAAKADEWLPVKPGTDLAFVMALIHVWIRDGKYDKEFVEKFTTGIEQVIEATKETTPKWQESITGIKAADVERIADEIWAAAPKVIIDWGHKTTTTRAEYQRTRAIAIANALMGNVEKKGGIYYSKDSKVFNKLCKEELFPTIADPDKNFKIPKTARIDGCVEEGSVNFFMPRKHGVLMEIPKAILSEKPYPVKGWVSTRFNHLINVADTNTTLKAIEKLDFIMVTDIYMSDFANLADVVFPEASYLERDESIQNKGGTAPGFVMRNKVIEPIGGTKSAYEIFRELARVMKIDELYTWKDINEFRMQQAKGNVELIANLMKDGYVTWKVPKVYYLEKEHVAKFVEKYPQAAEFVDEMGLMSSQMKCKTPSGKIELFSEQVEKVFPGEGCINANDMDVYNGHKYCLTSGKIATHTNGHTQNVKILNEMTKESPLWISPNTAKAEGLKTGDLVLVKNEFGEQKVKVFVTEGIRDDTLFVYHGFGHAGSGMRRAEGLGMNDSVLLDPKAGAVCATMVTNIGVDIVKI
ncbi:thiosulfate reductase PhsA [Campylobacter sp. VBCF_05 NA6]|uniref:thiosulfate reductase PhsA n=1 Tax=unclassified Campylobacter TaxID=2593542 RepID=UPI0022E9AA37|nr:MULTISPECIES: thiosulfate reductase PhsA [unclassified Campylobacter]MDA3057858.1 thiosulfate reductase PhsA [Campylobacter sp. VBCF_04 NA7]MDA3058768.1 thiosulfate reductase PhsA [Campylobacter sp. VBCF_05 NA6]